ncbi:MAG TPA: histone deacetylase family protein [Actinomycetota bacterium]|nr:histone deacetylase family protein [Actinomycetota bacterium]
MRAVYSPGHLRHEPKHEVADGEGIGIYEIPERAETIRRSLEADGGFAFGAPTGHGADPIAAVHDPAMLAYLEGAWRDWVAAGETAAEIFPDTFPLPAFREGMGPGRVPRTPRAAIGMWCFDTATPMVEGTYPAARDAVDVALTAMDLVLSGERAAYGLCRPPGHHAARAMFGGYCFFNNAAIVAEELVRRTGEPVAILDVDYHHGNGTQQLFYARDDVLYVSLHGDPDRAYPYFAGFAEETGAGAGEGTTLNLPLPIGCSNEEYLANLDRGLDAIAGFGGSTLVVSLGIDTYGRDPICDLALTTEAYHEVGRRVAALGRSTIVVQEGGYFVPHLGENVRNWLLGLEGREPDLSALAEV